ncbi:MAG: hypothetical protein Q7U44_04160 [Desulfuromonadales bacterium]|nr:hypothetical protein [Desulfuromonadales bacterium]
MKLLHASTLNRFFHFAIFIGPLAFLSGIIIAIYGDLHRQTNTTLTGLILMASGLIIWGCHGLRRRGKRPGFMLMATLGSSFFLLHLYYRYSDYRWVKINNISFDPATLTHLESRVVLFISILLLSVLIGILPPLPAVKRSRKGLRRDD